MPLPIEDLTTRYSRRKCERIVEATYAAFRKAIAEYGTLSADELLGIGTNLLMMTTILPLERLSSEPTEMRKQCAVMFADLIEKGSEEGN